MMKHWLASSLGLVLGLAGSQAVAQGPAWKQSDRVQLGRPVADIPAATLGMPSAATDVDPPTSPAPVQGTAYQRETESPASTVFRLQAADFESPPPFRPDEPAPPSYDPYAGTGHAPAPTAPKKRKSFFGEAFEDIGINPEYFGHRNGFFESDHCFDVFISPITNPFLFEDPRSLTEARPIFFIQSIPKNNPLFHGGNAEFYGTQLRVALTDRVSIVIHELGGVTINPSSSSRQPSTSGFAELHVGPKFTFLHSTEYQAVGAAGLIFQIPTGPSGVFQNTGNLSLTPYVSLAKNLFPTCYGSLNLMDTFGYTIRTDGIRSDYLYNSFHADWDVANRHIFYPLIELNWFHYTRSGTANNLGFEGTDFANIGSMNVSGKNEVNLAVGARYKFTEHIQVGAAAEFPLNKRNDMQEFRFLLDLIVRY